MSDANNQKPGPNSGKERSADVPQTKNERRRMVEIVKDFADTHRPTPPLSQLELADYAKNILKKEQISDNYKNYLCVLLNNEVWREALAQIPCERRLLLLPQCLRSSEECPAELDEFGLLCQACGRCPIGKIQTEAERLGYVVLIAEGTTAASSLIEAGKIEAIIGVSCLSVLERIFPAMEDAVIPGMAIPLLYDGCSDTATDTDLVLEALRMSGNGGPKHSRMDLNGLRSEVMDWFTDETLRRILGEPTRRTEEIALGWLAKSGKRWRPFLAVCVYRALMNETSGSTPEDLRKIAVAVECFHKASLVHDDIEDHDATRYGDKTLHRRHGTPIALNVGDLLLGEGYRLITELDISPERKAQMLSVAATGHRTLCIGQGKELCWRRYPEPLSVEQVVDIFRKKTAPAFEVALHLGAIYAEADETTQQALIAYSEALGIAYQIRDDLFDFSISDADAEMTPSLQLAVGWERAQGEDRCLLERVWHRNIDVSSKASRLTKILADLHVETETWRMLNDYRDRTIASLRPLRNHRLKALLRRVVGIIFNDIRDAKKAGKGRAVDAEARDASSRAVGNEATS